MFIPFMRKNTFLNYTYFNPSFDKKSFSDKIVLKIKTNAKDCTISNQIILEFSTRLY